MDAPVDIEMGMEKLEASFTLKGYNAEVLRRFGLSPGKQVPLTMRGSLVSANGAEKAIVVNLRGMLKEIDPGSWKPGEGGELKGGVSVFSVVVSFLYCSRVLLKLLSCIWGPL
uniref:Uncharacterized protein n=1 Tax=Candidatus Kentrum sp. FM TaxID=2126340 RepID=A0A450SXT5_9GAMM|nr:MAG: hypothetical protein BECKFM1743A_GA0114220_1002311 [Candidatus Kentron sp. FM]VFJ58839.1 MAG: hypothetical protein BECKFM1743C_GA0114222_102351 [Candidatus Kentron sp. FM]VFK12024.1 MAG: hypothetical protein BECKFM1743B_GA0114221_102211 [Candidatus Kentron sp. FM]